MDLTRLRQVVGIIARYGFGPFVSWASVPGAPAADGPEELSRVPASQRFRMMLEELGPIFIKFGQLLSTRPDILPPDFIEALSALQEEVSPLPWEQIEAELAAHLPGGIAEAFARVDPRPLATASVSQVHRGTLRSGEDVVVKVRRPEIDEIIHADLDLLRGVARLLESTVAETARYDPESWVEEFAVALSKELDLMNEVRSIETFRANGSETGQLVFPRVFEELSSPRVIVMSYLEGVSVVKVQDEAERKRVARILIGEAYKQIFVDGFFHADPHPGNIRYLEDGRIGLIDFGLVGRLTPRMKELVIRLTMAVAFRDSESAAKIIYAAGVSKERIDLATLSRDIDDVFASTLGRSLQDIDTAYVTFHLMELISRHGVTLPRGLALLGKAGVNIEGVVRTLDPAIDVSREALPYARKLISVPDDPMEVMSEALKQLLRLKGTLEEVPLQVEQILLDVSSGRLNINVSSRQLDGMVPSIRELGALLALGMVAAACVVAAAILVVPHFGDTVLYGIPLLPVLAVGMAVYAGFMMTLVVGWALFRGRDLRIRLHSWIPFVQRWQEGRRMRAERKARRAEAKRLLRESASRRREREGR